MNKKDKEPEPKNSISYDQIRDKHGKFFIVYFNHDVYDKISVMPNHSQGFKYDDILKRLKEVYNVVIIGDSRHPTKGNDAALFVTPPEKREYTIKRDIFRMEGFKIVVNKRFIIKNKAGFLSLLGKLISENLIDSIRGSLSYNKNSNYVYINLNNAIKGENVPFWHNIYLNFENLKCIFKHKKGDIVTVFSETTSKFYPIEKSYEMHQNLVLKLKGIIANNYSSQLLSVGRNEQGNVKLHLAEKLNVISRIIYAKSFDEGFLILKQEMKNLGFEVEVGEKIKD